MNGGAGSFACVGTVSLEQVVIDNDVYGHVFRQGVHSVGDATRGGRNAIAGVGPGNSYIMEEHTLAHFAAGTITPHWPIVSPRPPGKPPGRAQHAGSGRRTRPRHPGLRRPKWFLSEEQSC